METETLLRGLKSKSWLTSKEMTAAVQDTALKQGKRAVVTKKGGTYRKFGCTSSSSCPWFVSASRTRHKQKESSWHVATCSLEHVNCTGAPRPTLRQVAASTVVRSAIAADNSASVGSLSDQLKLQDGLMCNISILGRAREQIKSELFSEDRDSIQLLPSFLAELSRLNTNLHTELHLDSSGRFEKAIIVLDPRLVQLVLVGRDENMENQIASVTLVPVESSSNYKWFFGVLMSRGFQLSSVPVYTDRHAGIVAAADALSVRVHFCTRHIIGNMRADKLVKLQVSQESLVWGAQASRTKATFDTCILQLEEVNCNAAQYLKAMRLERWALYPHYLTTPLYGWQTTNFVESEQARSLRLKPRKFLPYEYFRAYSKILMAECYKRIAQSAKWDQNNQFVTPKADAKMQNELKHIANYSVAFSSQDVCYISHLSSSLEPYLEVCVSPPSCPCPTWAQCGLPGRHLLAALHAADNLGRATTLFSDCYTIAAYKDFLTSIRLPSEDVLAKDTTLLPSSLIAQAERPRKRRIRSRGESRARTVYQCKQCGQRDGHNKATCRRK